MREYEIFLKNDRVKFYTRFGWLITIINFATILYVTYRLNKIEELKWSFIIIGIVVLTIFIFKRRLKKVFFGDSEYLPAGIFICPAWMLLGFPWLALLNIFLFFFSVIAGRKPIVYLNQTAIYYPAFPKKSIQWSELSNVILKDGYLTIDFKNNKLIQQLVEETNTVIDEKEFNDFCKQQLNK